jgi:peptide/nickel transport system permease protein
VTTRPTTHPETRPQARRGRSWSRPDATLVVGGVLAGVPLLAALLGPLIAPLVSSGAASGTAPLLPPGQGGVLGTDAYGRDVLGLALTGGLSVVGLTVGALALAYLLGTPLGLLLAATRHRRIDTAALRLVDVALVLPPLLVLLVLAATGRRGVLWLLVGAAFVQLPAVVRLVRAAAAAPGRRAVQEAQMQSGEPWWRSHLLEPARAGFGALLVDAGTRVVLIVTVLTSANFLGAGLEPSSPDWGVVIQQNSDSLALAPAALLVPAALIVALCAGTNLLADRLLERREMR